MYGGSIYSFDHTCGSAVFVFFLLKLTLFFQKSQQNQTGFLIFSPDTLRNPGQAIIISYFTFPIHNRHAAQQAILTKPKVIGLMQELLCTYLWPVLHKR